jgi:DNA-binding MarR family transcriptional regulator
MKDDFDIKDFLPYLLNLAADASGLEFQKVYKDRYGLLRTEWRVLFHLGRYGDMTAKEICDRGRLHKTKVSRAVAALEVKRFLTRAEIEDDRRHSLLSLTRQGRAAFDDLTDYARDFDARFRENLTAKEAEVLYSALRQIAGLETK